jgi:hypothetical protein
LSAETADAYELEWRQLQRSGWGASAARAWGLSPAEEKRVLGRAVPSRASEPGCRRRGHYTAIDVPSCPVPLDAVTQWEELLAACVQQSKSSAAQGQDPSTMGPIPPTGGAGGQVSHPPYSLAARPTATPLEQQMHSELERSWAVHQDAKGQGPATAQLVQPLVQKLTVSSSCTGASCCMEQVVAS